MGKRTTHGHTRGKKPSKAYKTWTRVKARCEDVNSPHYPKYGGRGITLCERWQSFENFLADMGDPPAGLSIDRIDNNGPYAPGNCRWATTLQQNRNTRHCKLTEEAAAQIRARRGENTQTLAEDFGVNRTTINRVLRGEAWK
jgi:hypothetical protein